MKGLNVNIKLKNTSENNFLHSPTPKFVLLISMKRLLPLEAIIRAIVVLPVPGPPQSIIDGTRSCMISSRSTPCGPTSSWPQISSRVCGLIRAARGTSFREELLVFCFLEVIPSSPTSSYSIFEKCDGTMDSTRLLFPPALSPIAFLPVDRDVSTEIGASTFGNELTAARFGAGRWKKAETDDDAPSLLLGS
jgi:hypothetical protein